MENYHRKVQHGSRIVVGLITVPSPAYVSDPWSPNTLAGSRVIDTTVPSRVRRIAGCPFVSIGAVACAQRHTTSKQRWRSNQNHPSRAFRVARTTVCCISTGLKRDLAPIGACQIASIPHLDGGRSAAMVEFVYGASWPLSDYLNRSIAAVADAPASPNAAPRAVCNSS